MSNQTACWRLTLLLALTGLLAALVSISLAYPLGRLHLDFLPGTLFGALVSGCLAYCRVLRNPYRIIGFAVASTLADYLSIMVAGEVELRSSIGEGASQEYATISKMALFAGGFVGAFVIVAAFLKLVGSKIAWKHLLLVALAGSAVGGVLGVIGWVLGPFLGMGLWRVAHSMGLTSPTETFQNALLGQTCRVYSLWIVWQTGVGLLLGFALRGAREWQPAPS